MIQRSHVNAISAGQKYSLDIWKMGKFLTYLWWSTYFKQFLVSQNARQTETSDNSLGFFIVCWTFIIERAEGNFWLCVYATGSAFYRVICQLWAESFLLCNMYSKEGPPSLYYCPYPTKAHFLPSIYLILHWFISADSTHSTEMSLWCPHHFLFVTLFIKSNRKTAQWTTEPIIAREPQIFPGLFAG